MEEAKTVMYSPISGLLVSVILSMLIFFLNVPDSLQPINMMLTIVVWEPGIPPSPAMLRRISSIFSNPMRRYLKANVTNPYSRTGEVHNFDY